eukprot:SAG31_NODE_450_length_15512_cov_5.788555_1_plen_76_part_10
MDTRGHDKLAELANAKRKKKEEAIFNLKMHWQKRKLCARILVPLWAMDFALYGRYFRTQWRTNSDSQFLYLRHCVL